MCRSPGEKQRVHTVYANVVPFQSDAGEGCKWVYLDEVVSLISLTNRALPEPNALLYDIMGKGLTCPHKQGHQEATSGFRFLAK